MRWIFSLKFCYFSLTADVYTFNALIEAKTFILNEKFEEKWNDILVSKQLLYLTLLVKVNSISVECSSVPLYQEERKHWSSVTIYSKNSGRAATLHCNCSCCRLQRYHMHYNSGQRWQRENTRKDFGQKLKVERFSPIVLRLFYFVCFISVRWKIADRHHDFLRGW